MKKNNLLEPFKSIDGGFLFLCKATWYQDYLLADNRPLIKIECMFVGISIEKNKRLLYYSDNPQNKIP